MIIEQVRNSVHAHVIDISIDEALAMIRQLAACVMDANKSGRASFYTAATHIRRAEYSRDVDIHSPSALNVVVNK